MAGDRAHDHSYWYPVYSTRTHKPSCRRIADNRGANADDAASRFDTRSLLSRLSLKQNGLAVVHERRSHFVVAFESCERRAPRFEYVRVGATSARPAGTETPPDMRSD